jgi:hypothetical protein
MPYRFWKPSHLGVEEPSIELRRDQSTRETAVISIAPNNSA